MWQCPFVSACVCMLVPNCWITFFIQYCEKLFLCLLHLTTLNYYVYIPKRQGKTTTRTILKFKVIFKPRQVKNILKTMQIVKKMLHMFCHGAHLLQMVLERQYDK